MHLQIVNIAMKCCQYQQRDIPQIYSVLKLHSHLVPLDKIMARGLCYITELLPKSALPLRKQVENFYTLNKA